MGRQPTKRAMMLGVAMLAFGTSAPGQSMELGPATIDPVNPQRPLDQGIEDVDPLALSLRVMPIDLRKDARFERLYRDPTNPERMVRRAGGLTASFPASWYVQTRDGVIVQIPAGTVFQIGQPAPPPRTVIDEAATVAENRIVAEDAGADALAPEAERVVDLIAASLERATPIEPAARQPALRASVDAGLPLRPDAGTMSHETYRQFRLREIAARR